MASSSSQGTSTLLTDVVVRILRLLRTDLTMARQEVAQNAERAGVALGLVAAGAAIGLVGLIALAGAAVAGLVALGWTLAWAALTVGGVLALVAMALLAKGLRDLNPERLMPRRAMANVGRDLALLREQFDDRA